MMPEMENSGLICYLNMCFMGESCIICLLMLTITAGNNCALFVFQEEQQRVQPGPRVRLRPLPLPVSPDRPLHLHLLDGLARPRAVPGRLAPRRVPQPLQGIQGCLEWKQLNFWHEIAI